jgi:hypothetical protein
MARKLKGIPSERQLTDNTAILIGYLVIGFGLFEFALAGIVACVYHNMGGKRIESELPIMLSRSLTFVSKCTEKLPALVKHEAELDWIVSEARRLSPIRHDVIHEYLAEYDEKANHLFTFAKATPDKKSKTIHIRTLREITAEDLVKAGNASIELSHRAAALGLSLAKTRMP